ncbi:MAG: MFS transporter [Angustibacter sp.]
MTVSTRPQPVRRRDLIADPRLRPYLLATTIAVCGGATAVVTTPLLVLRLSGSPGLTALAAATSSAPYLLFGLLAGAWADRLDRRRLMVSAELLAAAALATVPVAAAAGALTWWHVLGVAFVTGVLFVWFDAATWGVLPALVGRDRLPVANSLLWSVAVLAGIVFPAVAGVVAAAMDPVWLVAVNAGTSLISASLLTRLPGDVARSAAGDTDQPARRSIRADIAGGLRYVWRQPVVRLLTLLGFAMAVSGGAVTALLVVLADQSLGIPDDDARIGLLFTAGAVGALVASLGLPRITRAIGVGRVTVLSLTINLAALAGLLASPSIWPALLAVLVWDGAYTLTIINGITVRQQITPDHLQSRVNTTGRMIAWGGSPVGAFLAGGLAEVWPARTVIAACGVSVAVATVAAWCSPLTRLVTAEPDTHTLGDTASTASGATVAEIA